jgi:hypothetical protein
MQAHFLVSILSPTIPAKEYRTQRVSMGSFVTKIIHSNNRNFHLLSIYGSSYHMEIYEISIFLQSGRGKEYRIVPDIPITHY